MSTRTIRPLRPVAPYVGGKRNLAAELVSRIQQIPHDLYAEAFVGMGGVFLRRSMIPDVEVINDYGRDLATFFRVVQRHYAAFLDMLKFQLTMRTEFERLAATDPATLTDMERAARFLFLQRTAFGGKVSGRNFGVDSASPGRFDVTKLVPLLEEVHARLSRVVIECLPYGDFLRRYDRPGALFYLDPPYYGCETDYGRDLFSRDDFGRLAEILGGLKGRFLLSLNDVEPVRAIFGRFRIEAVRTTYTVAGGSRAKPAGELIISGG